MFDITVYQLLILDLDGTVRECTVPGQPCPNLPGQQRLLPGAAAGIRTALDAGVKVAFATNQAGVALGYTDERTIQKVYEELFLLLSNEMGTLLDAALYACHHAPDAGCWCRKPSPGMLQRAMLELRALPGKTLFVGDRDSDREAAWRAACHFCEAGRWRGFSTPTHP